MCKYLYIMHTTIYINEVQFKQTYIRKIILFGLNESEAFPQITTILKIIRI